ncbi:MAG: hypothetical protein K2I64_04725 [Muribaculaceae bacterium]|nr:hypothetical protein [Muribaculaceae bacterium]
MNSKSFLALTVLGALALTGCSKKMNPFASDYFSVNPDPLEVVGERVPATVTARVPAKFFKKNATVTVTPYLTYEGGEAASQSYTFQGEKVRGNAPVVNYERGATLTIPVAFNYVPQMMSSQLYLAFNVTQGGKKYVLPRVKVADGVVATAALATAQGVTPAIGADKFQRIINEKYAADILFLINQANIRPGQLTSAQMEELNRELAAANADARRQIEEINIESYASPDGTLEFNTKLAQQRENNTRSYVDDKLRKDRITDFGALTANFTPEDWEGLKKLVAASNIQDKELILSVLSMYKDPEQREREIRNLSAIFDELAETILPQLRYSRITASINVIGKTDAEIEAAYAQNPSSLSIDELLYCATLTDDNDRKMAIYADAAKIYPNDYRTFNDLGLTQYIAGDYKAAKANFQQAARINPQAGEPQMNLALIAMIDKDYRNANQYLGSAAGVDELGDALGTYYILTGDNAAAVKAFGNAKTNNAALSQILTRDYSRAKSTLGAISEPDATTYYLMAVLGARTNNDNMVSTNLRQAARLDREVARRALNDLEFANYNISSILN